MKQRTFEEKYQSTWQTVEQWLSEFDKSYKTPDKEQIIQFPAFYRQLCHHLALARDRYYTSYLLEKLNRLALRGHQHLYQIHPKFLSVIAYFITYTFPRKVRAEAPFVAISGLLFFGALSAMWIAVLINPDLIYTLLESNQVRDIEAMYNPTATHLGRNRQADSDFLMFGYYIKNNTSIGFQTFAGGIVFTLGTVFFLVFNGLIIGGITGYLVHIDYVVPFFSFVAGHSALELTAIVLAGATGLKLGFALIAPQRYHRLYALRMAALDSMPLVYGFALMFFMAAFVEAFWSSTTAIDPFIKYAVGIFLWIGVLTYFIGAGRNNRAV